MDLLPIGILILLLLLTMAIVALFRSVSNAAQQNRQHAVILEQKLTSLEPVPQQVGNFAVELRTIAERVSTVEKNQDQVRQGIGNLQSGLVEAKTATTNIAGTTAAIRDELSRTMSNLTELQAHAKARETLEQQTAESIKRLEAVIAGTQSKGAAGEKILDAMFSKLPPEWQVRNFKVGAKAVEFGLRLPNNLILPIDSKWPATNLIEQFLECNDLAKQQRLKGEIEAAVIAKTKEVKKYIDPNLTVNFGIIAIPDSVYDLCSGIQAEAFRANVMLVSYSMLFPCLLLVFQTILKTSQSIDLHKLDSYIQSVQESIKSLQEEIEGRFSKAITMLGNSRDDMGAHLSKVSGGLTSLQISTAVKPSSALLPEPQQGQSE
jgi:DNA recombination protein RmuC